jgi:hypothetical protein
MKKSYLKKRKKKNKKKQETSANKIAVRGRDFLFAFRPFFGLTNSMQQPFFIQHLIIFQLVKKFVSVEPKGSLPYSQKPTLKRPLTFCNMLLIFMTMSYQLIHPIILILIIGLLSHFKDKCGMRTIC